MKYLLNCRSFISLMILFSFFDNFGMKKYDYMFKVVFVGDAGVGKTQIMNKFVENSFENGYKPTPIAEIAYKIIELENKKITLQLWNTSGQEQNRILAKVFYNDCQLIVLVYAINDKKSFENITNWIEDIKKQNEDAKLLLVGNKLDLEEDQRKVL